MRMETELSTVNEGRTIDDPLEYERDIRGIRNVPELPYTDDNNMGKIVYSFDSDLSNILNRFQ